MITIYGMYEGFSSKAIITRGMANALRSIGHLGGLNPCVVEDGEEWRLHGTTAEVAVLTGPLSTVSVLHRGDHQTRLAFAVPNSTWMPSKWIDHAATHATLVAPSHWAIRVLEDYVENVLPFPWLHGVSNELSRDTSLHQALEKAYGEGEFSVLHMTSSDRQRKGTEELLAAWPALTAVCPKAKLTVIADGEVVSDISQLARELRLTQVRVRSRVNLEGAELSRFLQRYHAVCQPSRGEGFGMVPLEARCCGVPAIMTLCTGHQAHAIGDGVHSVRTGDLAPIDDGPGALAPSLQVQDVEEALTGAYKSWCVYHDELKGAWEVLRGDFSWEQVTWEFVTRLDDEL